MKRFLAIAILLFAGMSAKAQNYPSEWMKYTTDGYFHDIESAQNKQDALDLARTNLAKQIQVKVKEVSEKYTTVIDGKSSILYGSQKSLSTEVDINLAQTLSHYNDELNKYYILAFINKAEACNYYENEIKMLISNSNNYISIADNYLNSGFKVKAKTELEKARNMFDDAGNNFFWMNVFGMPEDKLQQYLNTIHENEQTIKSKLADLEYGTTYCVVCNATNFGKNYPKLKNEIKGELSASGCNFVDDPQTADYVIHIDASSREYNTMTSAGGNAYFTYVDAAVSIDKVATNQRIFEDEISIKGSHTLSYDEAGRDGFKRISKEISKMLKENIEL